MNYMLGIALMQKEERRRMRRKIQERRLFWRHVEDAALFIGGIAALVVVWLRG